MNKGSHFVIGLRAVAIILILIDHFVFKKNIYTSQTFPYTFFRDGMNGIFFIFVTESYAATRALLNASRKYPNFSILKFYIKRYIWVLPTLYIYLLVIYYSGFFEDSYSFDSLIAGLGLSLNYAGKPYPDVIMHYWAFCAKETFIILFIPLIFLIGKNVSRIVLILIAVASIAVRMNIFYEANNPHYFDWWKYMETHLLLYMFAFGSLVALTQEMRFDFLFKKLKIHWLALLFLVIIGPYLESTLGTVYSWLYKSIAGSFCFAILVKYFSVNPQTIMPRLLSSRPLFYIGSIYYSFYVWQQLFTFGTLTPDFGTKEVVVYTLYSLGLGIGAYWLIERPLKRLGQKLKY